MSARILLTAVLEKPPTRLTSKAGKTYLRASVKDGKGPDARWWTVFAFNETAIEALEEVSLGESIAISGQFEASIWAPEGREPRVNLTLTADGILSARKPKAKPKARKAHENEPSTGGRSVAAASWAAPLGMGGPDDRDLPF